MLHRKTESLQFTSLIWEDKMLGVKKQQLFFKWVQSMYRENVKRTWAQPICTPSLKQNGGEGGRRAKKGVPALSSVCVRARVSSASTLFWIGVRTGWGQWQPIEKQKRKGPVSDTLMNRSSLDFSLSFCAFTSRGPRSTPSLPGLHHYQRRRLYILFKHLPSFHLSSCQKRKWCVHKRFN